MPRYDKKIPLKDTSIYLIPILFILINWVKTFTLWLQNPNPNMARFFQIFVVFPQIIPHVASFSLFRADLPYFMACVVPFFLCRALSFFFFGACYFLWSILHLTPKNSCSNNGWIILCDCALWFMFRVVQHFWKLSRLQHYVPKGVLFKFYSRVYLFKK